MTASIVTLPERPGELPTLALLITDASGSQIVLATETFEAWRNGAKRAAKHTLVDHAVVALDHLIRDIQSNRIENEEGI